MSVELSVNINGETARVLRWAELERGLSPEQVLRAGAYYLKLLDEAKEIYLVDNDRNVERIFMTTAIDPGDLYDF